MAFFSEPEVVAALVAAGVSLVIGAISGLYTIFKSSRAMHALRHELLERARVDRYTASRSRYVSEYWRFKGELEAKHRMLQEGGGIVDGTAIVQLVFDFIAASRKFYQDNQIILDDTDISALFEEIDALAGRGYHNDVQSPMRDQSIRELYANGVKVADLLYKKTAQQ